MKVLIRKIDQDQPKEEEQEEKKEESLEEEKEEILLQIPHAPVLHVQPQDPDPHQENQRIRKEKKMSSPC